MGWLTGCTGDNRFFTVVTKRDQMILPESNLSLRVNASFERMKTTNTVEILSHIVLVIFIQPYSAFSIDWTVKLVFMVIIGGIGTIEGPILGALIYVVLSQFLAEYFSVSMLILGGIAIVVILVAPKGIMGTLQDKLGFEILSPRRN